MSTPEKEAALVRAVRIAGGQSALCAYINANFEKKLTRQAISQWRRCPADRAIQIEMATGGRVTRHELRPDIYPLKELRETAA